MSHKAQKAPEICEAITTGNAYQAVNNVKQTIPFEWNTMIRGNFIRTECMYLNVSGKTNGIINSNRNTFSESDSIHSF